MESRRPLSIGTVLGATLLACASPGRPPLLGPPREQPAPLVGRWVRITDARADDRGPRERLILLADGEQWTERAVDGARPDVFERASPRAWWWVYRGSNGEADQLCLHWRGGRHRADCAAYQLDTAQVPGRALSRLRWGADVWVAAP